MPIKRLTALTVLAAALLVVAPVQADTTKAHSKTPQPKHAAQKHSHGKVVHAKPAHSNGKLAATSHKSQHSASAAATADASIDDADDTTTTVVAAVEPTAELTVSSALQAKSFKADDSSVVAGSPTWLSHSPVFNPTQMLVQSNEPTYFDGLAAHTAVENVAVNTSSSSVPMGTNNSVVGKITDVRKALIAMAMGLRDIRYVRGGHDPATGFDCSGFVRYVFAHAIGMQLPTNSASQFLSGLKVNRADMKPGDLVFFHTRGKRGISHVGIYISDGNFIHSPASGESVQISSLDDAYWAKHFAGAKRPEAMELAMVTHNG
jgi:cell wall-associated NlpC family hydrolase